MTVLRTTLAGLIALLCAALPGAADPLARPSGEVILTISGRIGNANTDEGSAAFDLAMLQALPAATIQTSTVWTEGVQDFSGVLLRDLLTAVGAEGSELTVSALNDYSVAVPVSDGDDFGAMLAYHLNGAPMSVRDKGPLWLVYPYDRGRDYRSETILTRSVWQLDRIEVLP